MLIKQSLALFLKDSMLFTNMSINVNCDIGEEIIDQIKFAYSGVISEAGDYRLLLLDAMKIDSAIIVQDITMASEEIAKHLKLGLEHMGCTYISVEISGNDSFESF